MTTTINPIAIAADVKRLAGQLVSSVDALVAQLSNTPPPPGHKRSPLKRPDNRLTEAGIDALYADFAAKTMTNKQLAKKHNISLSGVVKRKAMWRKGER